MNEIFTDKGKEINKRFSKKLEEKFCTRTRDFEAFVGMSKLESSVVHQKWFFVFVPRDVW